jgi:hypothetical protein
MACPVCYAPAADAAIRESMNLGIFVLLGVTFVVLAGFARFILQLIKRSKEAPDAIGAFAEGGGG